MRFLVVLSLLIFTYKQSNADWFCKENASTRVGDTINACGVGKATNLEDARSKSRESAIEEFNRICQLSSDCYKFDYTINPKRTDCEFKDKVHTCYRALDFEITDQKRKFVYITLSQLEDELNQKNKEINDLQEKIKKVNEIKEVQSEINKSKLQLETLTSTLNQKEAEAVKLEYLTSKEVISQGGYSYTHMAHRHSFKLGLHFWDSQITTDSQKDLSWMMAYEYRPIHYLGLQVHGGFGRGYLSNQKHKIVDVPTQGVANTTSVFNGTVAYTDIGLAALVYSGWLGTYLKLDYGFINGRSETYSVSYNNSGVGPVATSKSNFDDQYIGLMLGFDSRDSSKGFGWYFELGARKTKDSGHTGAISSLGVNYGF